MSAAHSADGAEQPATLTALAAELRAEGSVISPFVIDPAAPAALGDLVAAGPRAASDPAAYAAVVELVREGYLLHYGRPRMIAGADADLALLAGDYLYAKGLRLLARLDDLSAVAELADLIAVSARIHADGEPLADLAGASWLAAAISIGVDDLPEGRAEAAKEAESGQSESLLRWVRAGAEQAGLEDRLRAAAEAVGFAPFDRG